jgi:DNA-binding FadR family transcriptional regulator
VVAKVASAAGRAELGILKIQPAYRQISDQLRGLIIGGSLVPGVQLPNEEGLAAQFGVSRNTVREALRILASQGLVKTTRGVTGGTFVAMPDASAIQSTFETNLGLLSGASGLDKSELNEIRSVLEIPAARWAAERRSDAHVELLREAAGQVEAGRDVLSRTNTSGGFHQLILDAAGNRLLAMITPPVWNVFTRLHVQEGVPRSSWPDIDADHQDILHAIEDRDPDAAADAMRIHLERMHQLNV